MIFKRTLPILFGLFLISVAIRLPQLGRPLSKHHESSTATTLRILQIWWDNGIENYDYNPSLTYNNPADKFINNHASESGKMVDKEGNYYYVSHPPFAYYFPYAIFKLLNIRPDIVPLQLLNFTLHFICGLFVYFIVCLLSFHRARFGLYIPALVAFLFYVFSPATLWFQGNVYMSDMAVQTPFVIGVYIVLKMIIRQKFYVPKYIFFYVLTLFLMIYTSWLGIFFALGVLVYGLLHVKQIKGFRLLIFLTLLVTVFAVRLFTFQYSQIAGTTAYITEMFYRFLDQGSVGVRGEGYFHFLWSYVSYTKNILFNYLVNYSLFYIIIGSFIWLAVSRAKLKIVFSENGYRFIWLSVLPIFLLHTIFLSYSEHDFTVLYASLFLSVLAGILYDKVKKSNAVSERNLNILTLSALLFLIAQFTVSNLPGEKNYKGERYASAKGLGEYIKALPKNEVVFMYEESEPQVSFYAARNIKVVKSTEEAKAFLQARNTASGQLVQLLSDGRYKADKIEK